MIGIGLVDVVAVDAVDKVQMRFEIVIQRVQWTDTG
jgi:hypothetical protein